jgi:hypothetical protein
MKTCKACGKEWYPSVFECSCGKSLRRVGLLKLFAVLAVIVVVGLVVWPDNDPSHVIHRQYQFGPATMIPATPTPDSSDVGQGMSEAEKMKAGCKVLRREYENTKVSDLTPKQIRLVETCTAFGW